MPHRFKLKGGMVIRVKDIDGPFTILSVHDDEIHGWYYKHGLKIELMKMVTRVPHSDYLYNEAYSREALEPLEHWTACEIHYGINHHGSCDPDPFALAILKGDPWARDLAMDMLEAAMR